MAWFGWWLQKFYAVRSAWRAISYLHMAADGGYNQSQVQDLINKVDELIDALRR